MPAYSFLTVQATLAGPPGIAIDLGYGSAASEEGISYALGENKNTMTVGADGEGMHSLHAGKSGSVTVTLLKTSPVNQQLSLAYAAQSTLPSLWGQNGIIIRDTSSGDVVTCREVAFQKNPDNSYAKDGNTLSWVFDCLKIDVLLGKY